MKKIKKYDNLIIFIIIFILSIGLAYCIKLEANDEIWNFQNIYKIYNGYTLYKDANVIITPIFFLIGTFIFKILGANFFIFKLYNIFIYSFLFLIIYNIFKQLKIEKHQSFLYTLLIYYSINILITGGANYNILAVLFVLLGVLITIKYKDRGIKFNVLNGIILYLIFFTKQNIGTFYLIGTIILQLFEKRINKNTIKNLLVQCFILAILSVFTITVFYINGNLADFINYAVLGIQEFANNNRAIEEISLLQIVILVVIYITSIIYLKISKSDLEKNINTKILLFISFSMILIIYPIVNNFHTLLAMVLPMILAIYVIHESMLKDFLKDKITTIVTYLILFLIVIQSTNYTIVALTNLKFDKSYNNPYFGTIIDEEVENKIKKINEYIENKENKVIILSKEAAIYNIPKKRSNEQMDLPFLGNLGHDGENNLIKKIQTKSNYEILISKEIYWQESKKVIEYIKNTYEKIGELYEFEVYYIK